MTRTGNPEVSLRLHSVVRRSRANGPGLRTVLWTQGCTLSCPDCFNPDTHDSSGGSLYCVESLGQQILDQNEIQGFTISGGEPMQQVKAVASLLDIVRKRNALSVTLFSGFTLEQIKALDEGPKVLAKVDLLVAGLYDKGLQLSAGLLGSSNQKLHFLTDRYGPQDVGEIAEAEIVIGPEGRITMSGVAPLQWDI